jgi:hypothetical protein
MSIEQKEKAKKTVLANQFKYDPVPVRVKSGGKPFPFVQVAFLVLLGFSTYALFKIWF